MVGRAMWTLACLTALVAGALMAPSASARMYLLSQGYKTAERGEVEVGFFNDIHFAEADNDDSYHSKHQIELEYGVTDHLQLAYYEVYTWDQSDSWKRDEGKWEAKYRLAERGEWPVDVALYTEYKNPNGRRETRSDEIENKVIFSKDFGSWNVISNIIFERAVNTHDAWAFAYTAGVSVPVTDTTRIGLELKDTLGDEDEFGWHRKDHQVILLPVVSMHFGKHVEVLIGPAFGLTRAADDFQLRSLVQVEF